jgi:hypothetical protein
MLIDQGTTPTVVFLLVDATDDETAETGLSPTVQISKNGGSFATVTNSVTEIANGWYKVALTSTETNTAGDLIIRATGTGADEWRDVRQVIDFAGFKADVSALATAANLATLTGYVDTEVAAILAAVDTEVAAIKAKTDNLPADPADDGDIDAQLAAIAAYIDTEVAAIKAKTDNLPASPAAVGSAMTLANNAVSAAALAADAVAEIQSGLATAAGLAALNNITALDVWTYATRELTSGGGGASASDIWTYATRKLTDDTAVVDGIDTAVAALPTAVEIADAVLSRGVDNVESTADLLSLAELILATFESSIAGTDWTINQTDHVTLFDVRTVTVDANADPITGVEGGN